MDDRHSIMVENGPRSTTMRSASTFTSSASQSCANLYLAFTTRENTFLPRLVFNEVLLTICPKLMDVTKESSRQLA
ncbi:hypothetical protein RRG08_021125 [Elysia crispata]|uniref:Uncharacterized protein n=1 Tax=Elysia crispata TaxID=231223 RepID=A0AAE0Z7E5_9GAST|nr:hypothetical protein RRG08_021125 [Elysia crispata]